MPDRFNTPVGLERARCAVARHIYLHHLYLTRLALWLVPRDHPWRTLTGSALDETRELTAVTLHARNPRGEVIPHLDVDPNMSKGWRAMYVTLAIYLVYAVVARVHGDMPTLIPLLTDSSIWN